MEYIFSFKHQIYLIHIKFNYAERKSHCLNSFIFKFPEFPHKLEFLWDTVLLSGLLFCKKPETDIVVTSA